MALTIYTTFKSYNDAFSISATEPAKADFGDLLDGWHTIINADFDVLHSMLSLGDAQLLIGHAANGHPQARSVSGDIALTNTGVTTINPGVVTGSKIANSTITDSNITPATITDTSIASATITGAKIASATVDTTNLTTNARVKTVTGKNGLVLQDATNYYYQHYFPRASTLLSLTLVYDAASYTASTATFNVGKPGNDTYFVNAATSTASAAQWSTQSLTLANTAIAAGDILFIKVTSASANTQTAMLVIEYEIN